jgi:hypothetical protein
LDEQKRGLSVARLMDREKYYKDKALQLEKNFIFANEKIAILEEQLESLIAEQKNRDKENHESMKQLNEMKALYNDLENRYKVETESNQQLIQELQDEITSLRKHVRSDQDKGPGDYDQKIKSYERLLEEVQLEINEKDKELSHYKKRISVLEKRFKLGASMPLAEKPDLKEILVHQKSEYQAIAYLDFAIVFREKRCMVRGDIIIENTGLNHLGTPYICFRYTPGDAALIKGRIKTWETVESEAMNKDQWEWVFLDNDWAKEARERGEIWLYPTTPITITPGESIALNDWQIPIERKYYDHITVEVFVFFEESNYRVKGANQIVVNF